MARENLQNQQKETTFANADKILRQQIQSLYSANQTTTSVGSQAQAMQTMPIKAKIKH